MTDVLNMAVHEDYYSCGFYVVSAAMVFTDERGGMGYLQVIMEPTVRRGRRKYDCAVRRVT